MTDANAQLDQDLDDIATNLPGVLIGVRMCFSSRAFSDRRCIATFDTEAGPHAFEIKLAPDFDLQRWVRESVPPGTLH